MKLEITRKEAELILISLGTVADNLGSIDYVMKVRLENLHNYVYEEYMK